MTAEGVGAPGGAVLRVAFYRDAIGDDTLLGTAEAGTNWTLRVPTAGWAAGHYTLFARAQDNAGQWSQPAHVDIELVSPTYDLAGHVLTSGDWWMAASNGTDGFVNDRTGRWSPNVVWVDVLVGDFTGNGFDDIVGRVEASGEWWMAVNDGNGNFTNQRWGRWSPNVAWVNVMTGDFNGDGRTDLVGRVAESGEWWVAESNETGTGFTNARWGKWSTAVTWVDVTTGDFNGDGRTDIAGRVAESGEWWVAESNETGTGFANARWGRWSTAVTWVDVMTGDFNGDSRDDIVGRVTANGDWWVAKANTAGTAFSNERWGRWSPSVTWGPVLVGNFAPVTAALHAAHTPAPNSDLPSPISQADLQPVVEEAVMRLAPELDAVAFQVQIVDLPGLMLGRTVGNTIQIDHNAAGFGWYVIPTDADFQPGGRLGELEARPGTDAVHRIDLLTAVMHEMGHLLGRNHAGHGLMQPALGPGVRRLPRGEEESVLASRQAVLDDASLEPARLDAYFAQLQ